MELLVGSSLPANLQRLDLTQNDVTGESLSLIGASDKWSKLKTFEFGSNVLDTKGVTTLVTCESLQGLRELDLYNCGIGDAETAALVSGGWNCLRVLRLSSARLTASSLESIVNAPWTESLWRIVYRNDTPLGDDEVHIFETARHMTNLVESLSASYHALY